MPVHMKLIRGQRRSRGLVNTAANADAVFAPDERVAPFFSEPPLSPPWSELLTKGGKNV